jgi:hypothetical protein
MSNNYICFIYLQGWAEHKETVKQLKTLPTHSYFNAGQKRYVNYFSFETKEDCENWINTQNNNCYTFVHDFASKWAYQGADELPFATAQDLPKATINPDVLKLAQHIEFKPTGKVYPTYTEHLKTKNGKVIPLNWGDFSLNRKKDYSKKLSLALSEIITEVNTEYFNFYKNDLRAYCSSVLCNTLNYVSHLNKIKQVNLV